MKFAQWLDAQGVLWCHVPNESRSHVRHRVKARAAGLKPGVPDVLVFALKPGPWILQTSARGWAVELKAPGEKPSAAQRRWLSDLEAAGWRVTVCWSAAEAIAWCEREWRTP